jgi:hypothetical protein
LCKCSINPIFYLVARAIEEDEQHRVEHRHFDIEFDQGRQAVDGFTEIDRFGIEVNGFDPGGRDTSWAGLQNEIRSTASSCAGTI